MQMERVPYMTVVDCKISISTSDAEIRPLPHGFVENDPPLDNELVKYTTEADEHTRKHWLERLGWLVVRSGPGIGEGTFHSLRLLQLMLTFMIRGYSCLYTHRFPRKLQAVYENYEKG